MNEKFELSSVQREEEDRISRRSPQSPRETKSCLDDSFKEEEKEEDVNDHSEAKQSPLVVDEEDEAYGKRNLSSASKMSFRGRNKLSSTTDTEETKPFLEST